MKKRRKPLPRQFLQLERLEDRLALAGNVNVAINGGSLVVTGDDLSNQIVIESISATQFRVQGQNQTRINTPNVDAPNPLFEAFFDLAALTKDVKIDLKKALDAGAAGADEVRVDGLDIAGKLDIKGKNGGVVGLDGTNVGTTATVKFGNGVFQPGVGSIVNFSDCTIAKNLSITTGIDNDDVAFSFSTLGGNLTIKTNAGNDAVRVDGDYAPGFNILLDAPTIRGNVDIQTKDGNDSVTVAGQKVNGKTTIKAGKGENEVDVLHNVLGIASDFTVSSKVKCNDVLITSENAVAGTADEVTVEDNILARNLTITTKTGDDEVLVRNTFVGFHCTGNLKITTGDGNDTVNLDGRAIAGDTIMPVVPNPDVGNGNHVTGTTIIDTGKGSDDVQIGRGDLQGTSLFEGKATVLVGDGNNSVATLGELTGTPGTFASSTTFESDFVVNLGKDDDATLCVGRLVLGNHTISDKGGANVLASSNSAILGNLNVATGAGNDVFALGATDLTLVNNAFVAQNFVGGKTTVKTNAGNDLVEADNVNFVGDVTATLAGGRDQLKLHNGTQINTNTAVANGGKVAEDNRGEANGVDLAAVSQGATGFAPGGVDAGFEALVDAAIDARFGALIDEIVASI
jgi:hypothetical protein